MNTTYQQAERVRQGAAQGWRLYDGEVERLALDYMEAVSLLEQIVAVCTKPASRYAIIRLGKVQWLLREAGLL